MSSQYCKSKSESYKFSSQISGNPVDIYEKNKNQCPFERGLFTIVGNLVLTTGLKT